MQLSPLPQNAREFAYLAFVTIVNLIPHLITAYRNRKKSAIEEKEAEARAELAEASSQSLRVRDGVAMSEVVAKMLATQIDASDTIKEQQEKIFQLQQDNLELDMAREDVRRLTALIKFHLPELNYDDAAKLKRRPK